MRQLVFGGTFNPIHHGHLICSRAVAEELGFDQHHLLIPSSQPPHKAASATPRQPLPTVCPWPAWPSQAIHSLRSMTSKSAGPALAIRSTLPAI